MEWVASTLHTTLEHGVSSITTTDEPEFAGSNPAEAVGFLGRPENPQYAFLRRGSRLIRPMSQLCGM